MNRRKMLALLGASPALVAATPSYAAAAPKNTPGAAPSMTTGLITALNPAVTPQLATRKPLRLALTRWTEKQSTSWIRTGEEWGRTMASCRICRRGLPSTCPT